MKEMRGLNAEPEPAVTTGQMLCWKSGVRKLSQLRIDAEWWLVSSKGAANMVIIIQMSQQPDALDLEVWKMKPKPQPIDPELAPELASGDPILRHTCTIHADAHRALTPTCQARMRQTS